MTSAFITASPFSLRTALPRLHPLPHRPVRPLRPRRFARASVTMSASDRKMLHAVYRVGDLDATRSFLSALGMQVLRERDVPSEKYTNVFFGYGPEQRGQHFSLELTYNYGVDKYDVGTGLGNFGVSLPDASAAVERVRASGFKILRDLTASSGMFSTHRKKRGRREGGKKGWTNPMRLVFLFRNANSQYIRWLPLLLWTMSCWCIAREARKE